VEDTLAARYDRHEIAAWEIEGARFPEWLRKQLLGTLRGQKAVSAKQRRESKPLEKELALAKRKKGLPMTPDEVRLADASEKNGKVELLRRFEADRKRFEARFR
jgi:hypothetical protein